MAWLVAPGNHVATLDTRKPSTVGSHPACTLVMKEELGIALQHYRIVPYGSEAAELHSLAPLGMEVMLNGQQVDNEPLPLSDRDTITTGDLKLIFRLTDPGLDEIKPTALLEKKFEGEAPTGQAAREIAASDAPVPVFLTPAPVAGQSHLAPLALESLENAQPSGPGQLPEVSLFAPLEAEPVVPTLAMDALPPAVAVSVQPEVAPLPVAAEEPPEMVAPVAQVIEEIPAPVVPEPELEVVAASAPLIEEAPVLPQAPVSIPPAPVPVPAPAPAPAPVPVPVPAPVPAPAPVSVAVPNIAPGVVPAAALAAVEVPAATVEVPAAPVPVVVAAPAPIPSPVAESIPSVDPVPALPEASVPLPVEPAAAAPAVLPVSPEPVPVAAPLPGVPSLVQPAETAAPTLPVSSHSSRPSELFLPKKDAPKRATDAGRRADAARRTSMRWGFCVLGIAAAAAWALVAVYAFVDPARNMIHDLIGYDSLAQEKVEQIDATVDAKNPTSIEAGEAVTSEGVADRD